MFPNIRSIVSKIYIPLDSKIDTLVWKSSISGLLSFKDAYLFHGQGGQNLAWAKLIWCSEIPPSKSLLSWRLVHDKLPTDNKLADK
ncbi:ribonuclease H protein, partial [Trifolium medium]|nr:ribonuclease H protein [Trifolium medium]